MAIQRLEYNTVGKTKCVFPTCCLFIYSLIWVTEYIHLILEKPRLRDDCKQTCRVWHLTISAYCTVNLLYAMSYLLVYWPLETFMSQHLTCYSQSLLLSFQKCTQPLVLSPPPNHPPPLPQVISKQLTCLSKTQLVRRSFPYLKHYVLQLRKYSTSFQLVLFSWDHPQLSYIIALGS